MELQTFKSKEIEGIVFDGTFESSVAIAELLKSHATGRIDKFSIEHYNSGSRVGTTNLTFTLLPLKGDPNAKAIEYVLKVGDLLRVQPNNYEVINAKFLRNYWE